MWTGGPAPARGLHGVSRGQGVALCPGALLPAGMEGPGGQCLWSPGVEDVAPPHPRLSWSQSPLGVEGPSWVSGAVLSADQPVSDAGVDLALSPLLAFDLGPAAAAFV